MTRFVGRALAALLVIGLPLGAQAQGYPQPDANGHFGLMAEVAAEFGGDDAIEVFYRNGDRQTIRAGQGVTLSGGVHYQLPSAPLDFAATVGYKFVTTSDYHTDLGIYRVVFKLTGTYELPRHFWVDAGPVWHTAVRLNGDGYVPDVDFDDAFGGTVGAGWRWIGLSYTFIKYKSPATGDVSADNVGITAAFKF
jgi:hypothetical protein